MSDDNKAPGWRVREITLAGFAPVWAVEEGDRLVMETFAKPDARRIVEAVNGAGELTRERDELRAEVERLRGGGLGDLRIEQAADQWLVMIGGRFLVAVGSESAAESTATRLRAELAAAQARGARDAVERYGDPASQVEHTPDSPSTLAALTREVGELGATMRGLSEQVAAFAAVAAPDDEITKLRAVAVAVADWLDGEAGSLHEEGGYDLWDRLGDAAAVAVFGDRDRWEDAPAALRALAGGGR